MPASPSTIAIDSSLKASADGVVVATESDGAGEFGVEGEEMQDEVFAGLVLGVGVEEEGRDDSADAVVDAEAGFVVGVEGEEDGVVWEGGDALGEGGADLGGLEGGGVGGVVVEEVGERLMEGFGVGGAGGEEGEAGGEG